MPTITLDFETYSEGDLKACGAYTYAEHPSTEVLCLAWAMDGGGPHPHLWLPGEPMPPLVLRMVREGGTFRAHNAAFERAVWREIMHKRHGWPDIPLERWRCTMAACAYRALPLSLDEVGSVLNLPVQKDKRGKELIRKLCQPRKPTKADPSTRCRDPELLAELYTYCKTDVAVEQALHKIVGDLPPDEQEVWFLDQEINDRGVLVDQELARTMRDLADNCTRLYDEELSAVTGGAVTSCNQSVALARWAGLPSVAKGDVDAALGHVQGPVKRALELRKLAARSSTAKIDRLLSWVGAEGRARGMLQYHGAATGRWAGRGPQPQNFPRPKAGFAVPDLLAAGDLELVEAITGDPMEAIASSLRGLYIPSPGNKLAWVDFAAVEARITMWMAGQDDATATLARGDCLYCEMASTMYGKPVVRGMPERQDGKTVILGCGYGMGAAKFAGMYGGTEEEAKPKIDAYRERFPMVPRLWRQLEDAARFAIEFPGEVFRYGRVAYKVEGKFLLAKLPSGRKLHYYKPRLLPAAEGWKKPKIAYQTMLTSNGAKFWGEAATWGGDLTNHVVQGTARDLMVAAMTRCRKSGLPVCLTVHDEIVLDIPRDSVSLSLHALEELVAETPEWASGLPIAAEATIAERYGK